MTKTLVTPPTENEDNTPYCMAHNDDWALGTATAYNPSASSDAWVVLRRGIIIAVVICTRRYSAVELSL